MALTASYRAHLRRQWRELAEASLRGAGLPVAISGADLMDWASPLDDAQDRLALYALARMALASARCKTETARAQRRPALTALAQLALQLLGDEPEAAPALPFRADLDG